MKTVDETQNPRSTDAAVPDPERDLLPAATVFNLNIRRQALDWAVKLGAEAEHHRVNGDSRLANVDRPLAGLAIPLFVCQKIR